MYIQFIVSAWEEKIIAAEALAGWKHPEKAALEHPVFTCDGMSDRNGLSLELDMFEHVCRKLEAWKKKGWEDLQLFCTFSRSDFAYSFLAEKMIHIAEKYVFSPDRLIIGITENAAEEAQFFACRILRKLKDYGFRIALDDFGAGASSIKDMQLLPLDILKLDKSLLRGARSPAGEEVFKEVVGLGKRLRYSIICEGVETEAEMRIAQRAGVDAIQGVHYFVPVTEKEADCLLEQYYGWNAGA